MFKLKKDIEKALRRYPALKLDPKKLTINGTFIAVEKSGKTEIEAFEILIRFTNQYPFCFPLVKETSGKIPRDKSRHINNDGTICFGNPQDELTLCKNGISFIWFLDEILNAHLCREYAREKLGYYPTGERSHGNEGIWEGYYEIFSTMNKTIILQELELVLYHDSVGRNNPCYCNNGKKYKLCHKKMKTEVEKVGRENAIKLYEIIKADFNRTLII